MFSSQVAPNLVDSRKHNAYSNKSNNISIMSVSSAHVADLAGICFFKKEKINTLQLEHMQFFLRIFFMNHTFCGRYNEQAINSTLNSGDNTYSGVSLGFRTFRRCSKN